MAPECADVMDVLLDRRPPKRLQAEARLDKGVFVCEICVLSESGVDGRARLRYSGVNGGGGVGNDTPNSTDLCLGDADILVSTKGISFNAPELSRLSRWYKPLLTRMAFLFRSLCLRRDEVARDVCLVPSSASGAGEGD